MRRAPSKQPPVRSNTRVAKTGTTKKTAARKSAPPKKDESGPSLDKALDQVLDTLDALAEERGEDDAIWGSMIKQALKRRNPGFNERAHGFRSFNDLLLEAEKRELLELEADEKSGGYIVLPT